MGNRPNRGRHSYVDQDVYIWLPNLTSMKLLLFRKRLIMKIVNSICDYLIPYTFPKILKINSSFLTWKTFFLSTFSDVSGISLTDFRHQANQWCAEQPKVALSFAVISSIGFLPFITASALTPLVVVLNLADYVAENGKFVNSDK